MDRVKRGRAAEDLAASFLASSGLTLIERNWHCRGGEIDLVGLEGEVLVIVEVRQRGRTDFGGAAASVTHAKRRRLIRAAAYFVSSDPRWRRHALRFDVVAIQPGPEGAGEIDWIRGAFDAG